MLLILGSFQSDNLLRSFDRYRVDLKGSWKDEARPAAGMTYDLGAHLIDQSLALFGSPDKITAFIENIRGLGNPEVDDWVYNFASCQVLILNIYCLLTISSRSTFIISETRIDPIL